MKLITLILVAFLLATQAAAQSIPIRLAPPPPGPLALVVVTTDCPDGAEIIAYDGCTFIADGGTSPYTWAEVGSALNTGACAGLTLTDDTVDGTPTSSGTCTFTIRVTDDASDTADREISLEITEAGLSGAWVNSDVGSVGAAGTANEVDDVITIHATGAALSATADGFHYVYQPCTDDCEVIAEITSVTSAQVASKAGVMIRESLTAGSSHMAALLSHPEVNNYCRYRPTTDATTTLINAISAGTRYLRVRRIGDTFTASRSSDGSQWIEICSTTISMGSSVYAGLVLSSLDNNTVAEATYENYAFDDTDDTPPPSSGTDFGGYRPHYQAFGADTVGGRGGILVRVTNLNNDGAGSFRQAVETRAGCDGTPANCARTVVFDVSGSVVCTDLGSSGNRIEITDPYLTIAGQTAPAPGFVLTRCGFRIHAAHVVVQHITVLFGDDARYNGNPFWIFGPAHHVVLDHNTALWATDENCSYFGDAVGNSPQDIALYDNICSEGLRFPDFTTPGLQNSAGGANHSKGSLGANGANVTASYFRNVFSHNSDRNPLIGAGSRTVGIGNITFNAQDDQFGSEVREWLMYHGGLLNGDCVFGVCAHIEGVWRSNINIEGGVDAGTGDQIGLRTMRTGAQVNLANNIGRNVTGPTGDGQWANATCYGTGGLSCAAAPTGVRVDDLANLAGDWYRPLNIIELSTAGDNGQPGGTSDARACVLANVGAWPAARLPVATRNVGYLASGDGQIIDSQNEVGGYPTVAQNTHTWADASNPNDVATSGTGANGVRTNREVKLENEARALEAGATCNLY